MSIRDFPPGQPEPTYERVHFLPDWQEEINAIKAQLERIEARLSGPKFAIHSHPVEVLEPVPSETECSHPGDTLYTGVVKPVEERRTMSIVGRAAYGSAPYWQDRDGRWTDRGCGRPPKPATYPTPTEPGWYWVKVSPSDRDYVPARVWEYLHILRVQPWEAPHHFCVEAIAAWGPRIPEWRPEAPHA